MPKNNDPFAPWNSPMHENDPFAPHNNPMDRDNPFKPWNSVFGRESDLNDRERESYGIPSSRRSQYDDED